MTLHTPKITGAEGRPVIRQLDDAAINRIAAGEVVERPASAVKELVENALDAGAARITVDIADGGKTLIRVTDDGCGMTADDLPLALSRHATSKIDGTDLLNIRSFGFRGEALPSLGAVGRLTITSRAAGNDAAQITCDAGRLAAPRPAAMTRGTVVELRDLFYATPARLKFLRSGRAEVQAVAEVIRRLAMAEPHTGFTLNEVSGGETRVLFRADPQPYAPDALARRLSGILGHDFIDNALPINAERDGLRLTGYAALPTYSRGSSAQQHVFVNGRPVLDRMLLGALRAAYFDVLSRDRHPAAVLNLIVDPARVDVNVHPAKAEVRFREPDAARSLIITGLRTALSGAGHRASTTVAAETLSAFRPEPPRTPSQPTLAAAFAFQSPAPRAPGFAETPAARIEPHTDVQTDVQTGAHGPLGAARAQLHENYIIAQTATGVVIVDQHAAHERLVYERLKAQMAASGITAQALLIPEIVDLSPTDAARLLDAAPALARLGLAVEPFGGSAVCIRETPAILGPISAEALVRDILDELADAGDSTLLQAKIDAILSRMSCHGSVRSGRQMRAEEMNALLREMEATPLSGQCNHGRPTYVELKLADIERLFGRR
ncbi:MAG: DNA mismatch repair endonuclease MutL [Tabrizicola sp.]|uniref:DNA mismatch repair endonuclease MutL n=1 Tax=Tabrizicola sp. TaxID=2005166 RepID=UPI00273546D3|nr:DNA mismatch repair endonuclease MutL [Tabrizicola sp.]MDP3262233.1 DNA mismatch repair endonuclease MutL [Tabrizicola sp.]MDP3648020.1 DNA mismatch repair endonuclease MutL [Paracoccaceae bacterium]MDZ4068650.1 DNA mismatch repair endonuclease MutL [Tabrizicola sp.]